MLAILVLALLTVGAVPLVDYLMPDEPDQHAINRIRDRLRQTGWTRLESDPDGETWGRQLTRKQSEMCVADRFVIPAHIGPFTVEALEQDLARLAEDAGRE